MTISQYLLRLHRKTGAKPPDEGDIGGLAGGIQTVPANSQDKPVQLFDWGATPTLHDEGTLGQPRFVLRKSVNRNIRQNDYIARTSRRYLPSTPQTQPIKTTTEFPKSGTRIIQNEINTNPYYVGDPSRRTITPADYSTT